jgi:hypothetical protein
MVLQLIAKTTRDSRDHSDLDDCIGNDLLIYAPREFATFKRIFL